MGVKTVQRYSVPMDGVNIYRFQCDAKVLPIFEIDLNDDAPFPTNVPPTFHFWAEHYFDELVNLKTTYDWSVIVTGGTIPDDWEYVGSARMSQMYHLYRKEAQV
jgi:hypothetical protein